MISKKIQIISGLDCPWCWLAHEEILRLNLNGYQFEWLPFILKPDVDKKGESFQLSAHLSGLDKNDLLGIDNYVNSDRMKDAARELGIKWVKRIARYNVVDASIVAIYAQTKGLPTPYITAAFRQYFQATHPEERNLADRDVLRKVAEKAGLDAKEAIKAIETPKYIDIFEKRINYAKSMNVTAVPTYFYKDRSFSGFVTPENFENFVRDFTK